MFVNACKISKFKLINKDNFKVGQYSQGHKLLMLALLE